MNDNPRSLWQDRLLRRRSVFDRAELEDGLDTIIVRDELLCSMRYADDIRSRDYSWIEDVDPYPDAMLARIKLRPGRGLRPEQIARDLNAEPESLHPKWDLSPNHVLAGMPGSWGGGPAAPPGLLESPPRFERPPPYGVQTGPPITVVVMDTGVSAHPWFEGSDWFADVREQDFEVLDELPRDDILDAQAGHGTFIIGVVLQHAPRSWIVPPQLLTSDGVCDEFSVVRELRRLKRGSDNGGRKTDVLNLSFGGPTFDDRAPPHLAEAIAAMGPDTVVVACAGNDNTTRKFWPAALEGVIAVGALDSDGSDRAPFSNYGPWVDACSIGERVASSFVTFNGPVPATGDFDDDNFKGFAQWSGTSFATPQVAGAIAALAMRQGISAPAAAAILLNPATTQSIEHLGVVVPGI